jgi:hypothetical protein
VQFAARTASEAVGEPRLVLETIRADYVDAFILYDVERAEE